MLNVKKWMTKVSTWIKNAYISDSLIDTTASTGWILLKYNNSNVSYNTYEVVSAYNNGKLLIPFVSGGNWYVKACEYGTMASVNNTQLTVYYTLRKK